MTTSKLFYRFCGIVTIVALLSVSLFAQDKPVPTQYASYLNAVNAPYAWNKGYTGQGVVVGVIDDSVDMTHPYYTSQINTSMAYNTGVMYNSELAKYKIEQDSEVVYSFPAQEVNNTSAYWDTAVVYYIDDTSQYGYNAYIASGDSHGTSVTGCIAAYDTESMTYGPAYNATIAPIRVDFNCQSITNVAYYYDDFGFCSSGTIAFAQAVEHCNASIDIKNNSYGNSTGYRGDIFYEGYLFGDASMTVSSFDNARANNTILLFSAGNERQEINYSNCKNCSKKVTTAHPYTITVAATGTASTTPNYNEFAPFSDYGSCVFISAPGVYIQSSDRDDNSVTGNVYCINEIENNTLWQFGYNYQGSASGIQTDFSGTSASCPVASGVLALALDAYKQAYPDQTCDVRYIKQLLARTSTKIDVNATAEEVKWVTNNAGISFSHTYGFGQINAQGLIDAICDPETTLGGNYTTVTPQTKATINWDTEAVSSNELLSYLGTFSSNGNSGGSYQMSKMSISEQEMLAAAVEYQSGSAAYVTQNNYQLMAESEVFNDTLIITEDTFLNSGILKQDLEEVVVTLTATADNTATGFDPRYMQITLDHDGTTSILAFADPNSAEDNLTSLTWSFSSNAFWGEDPTGMWTLSVLNTGTDKTFNISDVYSTFYMGTLEATPDPTAAVPEPTTWALLALGVIVLYMRKRK